MNVTTADLPVPDSAPPPEPVAEPRWQPAPAPLVVDAAPFEAPPPELDEERSEALAGLWTDSSARGAALRAGAGLLGTLPFAVITGFSFDAPPLAHVSAALALPVALALIALVGLSASTIGVSLLSRPLSPAQAADAGARGLLRTGQVLLGLTPVCALWVLSYGVGAGIVVPALAWALAGVLGIATIHHALLRAIHSDDGGASPGTLAVLALFTLFAVVLGVRCFIGYAALLMPSTFLEEAPHATLRGELAAEGGAR